MVGISGSKTGLIEVSRTLDNQYGGNTYESRSRNTYMRIDHIYQYQVMLLKSMSLVIRLLEHIVFLESFQIQPKF